MEEGDKLQRFLSLKDHHHLLATDLKELCCKQYSKARTPVVPCTKLYRFWSTHWLFRGTNIMHMHTYYIYQNMQWWLLWGWSHLSTLSKFLQSVQIFVMVLVNFLRRRCFIGSIVWS